MTLCPIKLWDAALTLENDGEFYKAYKRTSNATYISRRTVIADAARRLHIATVEEGNNAIGRPYREQLRRYFDDIWGMPKVIYAGNACADDPTIEFWKDEVRYPPAKKDEEAPAKNPYSPPEGYFGPLVGSTYRPAQPSKPPGDWPNRGATWTEEHADYLRRMYCGGFAFSDMCRRLGRSPDGILYKLKELGYLKYRSENNSYLVQPPPGVPQPPLRPAPYLSNTVPADDTTLDQPQPTKEAIMTTTTNAIEITTKTLINGQDIKGLTDSQIYSLIADQEAEIKKLEAIENKPKRLVAEIEKRKAGIKALVDYLDSKEAK